MDHAFEWVIENHGIDTEKDYKYHAAKGECNVAREDRHVVTIDSFADGMKQSSIVPCTAAVLYRMLDRVSTQRVSSASGSIGH